MKVSNLIMPIGASLMLIVLTFWVWIPGFEAVSEARAYNQNANDFCESKNMIYKIGSFGGVNVCINQTHRCELFGVEPIEMY